jgi:hypothetical protein
MDINDFLECKSIWKIVQNGPYIGNKVGVRFLDNEVKMSLNQTNNHRLPKNNFKPIADVEHWAHYQ